ncbi:SDR family oxidoreductase [Phaeobacter sp. J2-8]|uniref:SDR family NAD(P)-dependent oxidoreductase n=1 Tax=Phaeobacter sp. J2-8 TaxID=2931394 RepID=UPI001FD01545|nr:SDR family oxidoreductase [Phaeobacter sp. J2-8]MCJ7870952.1 SDR family oxidoreductase [Phaeobacter sp. J2-8]
MTKDKDLAGKTAVITGAGRGLGRSIAMSFARAGADIAICSRTVAELEAVKSEVEAEGVRCLMHAVDLSDEVATKHFCDDVLTQFGKIDVLVNNAGAQLETGRIEQSDPGKWWKTIEINVRGPYLVTRFLLDGISEGGKIINVSSGMGKRPGDKNSAYHISKAAMNMFTDGLANELWPRKIDVNNLIPGPVATSMLNHDAADGPRTSPEDVLERFAEGVPPGFPEWERLKHPDEVGELALYMATRPIGGPTGQSFSLARRPLG